MMFLRAGELIPLYATEWLILGIFGLLAAGLFAVIDFAAARSPWRVEHGFFSRVGFAIVVAVALFFGALAWITSFKHSSPSLRPWLGTLIIMMLAAGSVTAFGYLKDELAAIGDLARFLSLAGSVTLLSLFFNRGDSIAAPPTRPVPVAGTARTNIVLVTIDALAANHLSIYGYSRPTSPQIGQLSTSGIVFERFYANSNFTSAGVASMLTGVLPWTHRVLQLQGRTNNDLISESIPARLHAAGYTTAYFGSNPWAGGRVQGYSQFFDHKESDLDWPFGPCFDVLANAIPYLCVAASNRLIQYSYSALVHAAGSLNLITLDPHSNPDAMVERVARWTHSVDKRAPIFLWVHFFPPHDPYSAPAPWLGLFDHSSLASNPIESHPAVHFEAKFETAERLEALKARYDESIAYVDHSVGELISTVRKEFGPNTAIFLTADHGESFDHGYGSHGGVMLYEDLIHIPLIISLPSAESKRRDDLASQVDIAPTMAAVAGIPVSPAWVGRSLLEAPSGEPIVFAMNFEENVARQSLSKGAVASLWSHWKSVQFFGKPRYPDIPVLNNELFDLRADPTEHNDLIAQEVDVASKFSADVRRQLALHGRSLEN
jgi:arylsulfatase A-like enzyme